LSLRRKEAIEQLLQMSKGREFQIVRVATEKLLRSLFKNSGYFYADSAALIHN